jgi:hypothetical protein
MEAAGSGDQESGFGSGLLLLVTGYRFHIIPMALSPTEIIMAAKKEIA